MKFLRSEVYILHLFVRVLNENGLYTKNTRICTAVDKIDIPILQK